MQEELVLLPQAMVEELLHGEEVLWWTFKGASAYLRLNQVKKVLRLVVQGEGEGGDELLLSDSEAFCPPSASYIEAALAYHYARLVRIGVAVPLINKGSHRPVTPPTKEEGPYMDLPMNVKCAESPAKSEGVKHDKEKLKYHLIPWQVLEGLASVLTFGAKKYSPENWRLLADPEKRYEDAMWRHLIEYKKGNRLDKDSKMPHLWHCVTNLAFLIYFDYHLEKEKDGK